MQTNHKPSAAAGNYGRRPGQAIGRRQGWRRELGKWVPTAGSNRRIIRCRSSQTVAEAAGPAVLPIEKNASEFTEAYRRCRSWQAEIVPGAVGQGFQ